MEFSFRYFEFLKSLEEHPEIMVFGAAFGTPVVMFILVFITKLYKNSRFKEVINMFIFGSLGIIWIVGFIVMILLTFTEVSGIKLLLIWLCLCLTSFVFVATNMKPLIKLYNNELKDKIAKKSL